MGLRARSGGSVEGDRRAGAGDVDSRGRHEARLLPGGVTAPIERTLRREPQAGRMDAQESVIAAQRARVADGTRIE